MPEDLHALRIAVQKRLMCKALEHRGAVVVDETFEGQMVWSGEVHEFEIQGHPDTDACYAWSSAVEGSTKRRYYAVLKISPVDSPKAAVRAAIVVDHKAEADRAM